MSFFLKVIIILFSLSGCSSNSPNIQFKSMANNTYFDAFNESFGGVVKQKKYVMYNKGLVFLDLDTTTTYNYDIRETRSIYFCVIKDNKAEIISGRFSNYEIGDYVFFDGIQDSITIKKHNGEELKWGVIIDNTANNYRHIVNKHEL